MKKMMLMLLVLLGACWAGVAVDYEVFPSDELPPGTSGMVELTITNSVAAVSGSGVASVTVSSAINDDIFVSVTSSSTSRIISESSITVGQMRSGAVTMVSIPFEIPGNVSSGVYPLYIRVNSNNFDADSDTRYTQRLINVPITVKKPVSLSLSITPNIFEQGLTYPVQFTIQDNGEPINNCNLIIDSEDVRFENMSSLYLGSVKGTKIINSTLYIDGNADTGQTTVPIIVEYTHALGVNEEKSFNVPIIIKARNSQFSIITLDTSLKPNTRNDFVMSVKNNGDHVAKNVEITFNDDFLVPISQSSTSLGTLLPGEVKDVTIPVAVKDVEMGYDTISFMISYNDENNNVMVPETVDVGVDISSPPDLDVYIVTSPIPLTSEGQYTFSVQATNVGVSNVKALTIDVVSNDVYKVLDAESEQFIGNLEADDFSTVQYKMLISSVEEGQYPLEFKVGYLDSSNNPHEIVITKKLNVYNAPASNDTICIFAILIIVIIAGLIIYFKYYKKSNLLGGILKRNKKNDHNEKEDKARK